MAATFKSRKCFTQKTMPSEANTGGKHRLAGRIGPKGVNWWQHTWLSCWKFCRVRVKSSFYKYVDALCRIQLFMNAFQSLLQTMVESIRSDRHDPPKVVYAEFILRNPLPDNEVEQELSRCPLFQGKDSEADSLEFPATEEYANGDMAEIGFEPSARSTMGKGRHSSVSISRCNCL